jgi:hypothetical protein
MNEQSKEKKDMFSKPHVVGIIEKEGNTLADLRANAGHQGHSHSSKQLVMKAGVISKKIDSDDNEETTEVAKQPDNSKKQEDIFRQRTTIDD